MSYSALDMHNLVKMHPHKRDTCAILALLKTGFSRISPKVCICYIYIWFLVPGSVPIDGLVLLDVFIHCHLLQM